MTVEENWYERYYSADYAASVRSALTPGRTRDEIDFLVKSLSLTTPRSIADVGCGEGRHTIELARRGFDVVGVDLNEGFLAAGRACDGLPGTVTLINRDMREAFGRYDVVLSLFNSFGFFPDADNELMLESWSHSLNRGGSFVIDLWNRDALVRRFMPVRQRVVDDTLTVSERCHYDAVRDRLEVLYAYAYADGTVREYEASFRLYSAAEMRRLFERQGLTVTDVFGSLQGAKYAFDSERLVMIAKAGQ